VGHSLGSILSGEISSRFGGAKTLIALDPPSEPLGTYKVYKNLDQTRKNFDQYAQFSRSFVGKNSFAGNQGFAKTANEKIVVNFNSTTDFGTEHGLVVQTFNNLISSQKVNVSNSFLSQDTNWPIKLTNNTNDSFLANGSYDGFDTEITAIGNTSDTRTNPETIKSGLSIYGGSQDNTMQSYSAGNTTLRGNGGNDIFENYGITESSTQTTKIVDFTAGDKISLKTQSPIGFGTNYNTYSVISICTGTGPGCPSPGAMIKKSTNGSTLRNEITVEGYGAGGVTPDSLNFALNDTAQQKLDSQIQLRNN
jgi:hypothetical protein